MGPSTLSTSSLLLSDEQSAEITIIPLQYSQKENDVVLVAQVDGKKADQVAMTNAAITVTQDIKNPDTPAEMRDRIPPRVYTTIYVTVNPAMPGKKLTAQVANQSNAFGRTKFEAPGGKQTDTVSWTTGTSNRLDITGQAEFQTQPGNAGNLIVQIVDAKGNIVAFSKGFSVAAIPIAVRMSSPRPLEGVDFNPGGASYAIQFGTGYLQTYISDSGPKYTQDLSGIKVKEVLSQTEDDGFFTVVGIPTSGPYLPGNQQEVDGNVVGVTARRNAQGQVIPLREAQELTVNRLRKQIDAAMGEGMRRLTQYFIFVDTRTGGLATTQSFVVKESGFQIVQEISPDYIITTTRTAIAVGGAKPGRIFKTDNGPEQTSISVPAG